MSIHRDGTVVFDIDGSVLTADAGAYLDPSSGTLTARINGAKQECTVRTRVRAHGCRIYPL